VKREEKGSEGRKREAKGEEVIEGRREGI